jgi:hypothetical protein
MNFLTMVAALAGSLSVSPMTSSRGRPLMPPALLIWSTAISATSLVGVPMGAPGPDSAKKAPILMGCFWSAALQPTMRITRATAVRTLDNIRLILSSLLRKYSFIDGLF